MVAVTTWTYAIFPLTLLILALSVTIIGLSAHNIAWMNSVEAREGMMKLNTNSNVIGDNNDDSRVTITIPSLPKYLATGSVWAFFATGLGGIIDALIVVTVLLSCPRYKLRIGQRIRCSTFPILVFVCVASVVRSLITAVYGWVTEEISSARFTPGSMVQTVAYSAGTFYYGQWVCDVASYTDAAGDLRFQRLCREVKAYMSLGIVVGFLWIIALVVTVMAWRKDKVQCVSSSETKKESAGQI